MNNSGLFYDENSCIEGWEGNIQLSLLLQKVAESLLIYDIFLMHGATICFNESAYIFSGASGIGKTTHILKWLDSIPDVFVVNGDKPFIKFDKDGKVLACGSPWAGKENMNTNVIVPVKAIILMERAENNYIEQISFGQAFISLLQQIYRPDDADKMRKTLRLLKLLDGKVSFYRFQCNNFKGDSFRVTYEALTGNKL